MKEYFECSCATPSHLFKMGNLWDDEIFCVQVISEPNQENIFRRIWTGIKYVFGYDLCWHEIILRDEDIQRISNLCEDSLSEINKDKG